MFANTEPAWFGGNVPVVRKGNVADVLGVDLHDTVIARLAGAFRDAVVEVHSEQGEELLCYVTHPKWIERGRLNRVSLGFRNEQLVLELEAINLTDSAPDGLGAVMLLRMVRTCQELGVNRLTLLAAGGRTSSVEEGKSRYWGYYAWPRFGFNFELRSRDEYAQQMEFLAKEFPHYPVGVKHCQDVLSLMEKPGGDKLWCVGGFEAKMDFDLAPESLSVQTLTNYLTQKGLL